MQTPAHRRDDRGFVLLAFKRLSAGLACLESLHNSPALMLARTCVFALMLARTDKRADTQVRPYDLYVCLDFALQLNPLYFTFNAP